MDQDEFCERMWPRLVAACISFTGSAAVGEDLAQEALTRALVRWKKIDAMEAPEAYVMTIAMNLARSHWRRRNVERRVNRTVDATSGATSGLVHEAVVERLDVARAILELPERQRMAVVLRYQADLSITQTAAVMGCADGTVKALTHQGLERLRVLLGDPADQPDSTPTS